MTFERQNNRISLEPVAGWVLRLVTYLIIVGFALILGRIVIRGVPALAGQGISFVTESPQVLYRFFDENGKQHRLNSKQYEVFKQNHPAAIELVKESAKYSGGGILGPMIGTIFLILIGMTIAMAIGITSAIFLTEYGSQGRFVQLIRLGIDNLAGVPSIVFGLFGMAFFCFFFPVITKNAPTVERSALNWELPSWMIPNPLADEGYRIYLLGTVPEDGAFARGIVVSQMGDGIHYSVFDAERKIVKRLLPGDVSYKEGEREGILATINGVASMRDAASPTQFYREKRTSEEKALVEQLRPLLKFERRLWVSFQGWRPSLLAAGCTLACMVLPIVIMACEKSLRMVPQGFRDASLALGATQWQTITQSVLPYALPGMLAASVLAVLRVAGEVAPIMFTGAFATADLPWVGLREENPVWRAGEFLQRGGEAMPYHIYLLSSKIPQSDLIRPMQDGAVLIFMIFMLFLATVSIYLRRFVRKNFNGKQLEGG